MLTVYEQLKFSSVHHKTNIDFDGRDPIMQNKMSTPHSLYRYHDIIKIKRRQTAISFP